MKIEYTQNYACEQYANGSVSRDRLKVVEVMGEKPLYFHNGEPSTEQEFRSLHGRFKGDSTLVETSTITQYDDAGKKVSDVSYFNADNKTSLSATVQVGEESFEYEQIKAKRGKLYAGGKMASSYMRISFAGQESEYVDRQPRLDDPLLDKRDEIITPYTDVLFGRKKLAEFAASNEPV